MPLITLTSDFGEGTYVAQVKGVILSLLPDAEIVDVTHAIAAGDVLEAAYVVETVAPAFPEETTHVVVVDPGVGTDRRAIGVRYARRSFLGPDNGVLTSCFEGADEVREVTETALFLPEVSPTFHGRDVFAPVAAHLAGGLPLAAVGPVLEADPVVLGDLHAAGDEGVVLSVDRFGNLITSFPAEALAPGVAVDGPGAEVADSARTFGEAGPGRPFLYAGSAGRLEVAVPGESAAEALGWGRGERLTLRREGS
ncbi:MAG: SAM hydrolase/SAM-dependent halogenase family protein [Planctomycetota bacterium]|jgi:S-adenosylmethionine hydrolase